MPRPREALSSIPSESERRLLRAEGPVCSNAQKWEPSEEEEVGGAQAREVAKGSIMQSARAMEGG